MFRVDVQALADQTQSMVQVTQNMRVIHARAEAAQDGWAPSADGGWFKAGKAFASNYEKKLGQLEDSVVYLTDTFIKAEEKLEGSILPSYNQVLGTVGVASPAGKSVYLDNAAAVYPRYDDLVHQGSLFSSAVNNALDSLPGLDRSGGIRTPLDLISASLSRATTISSQARDDFEKLATEVKQFEETYSALFDPAAFDRRVWSEKVKDGVLDTAKNVFSSSKHGFNIGSHLASIVGYIKIKAKNPYGKGSAWKRLKKGFSGKISLKNAGKFLAEEASGAFDFAKPSKWGSYWKQLRTGKAAEKLADRAGNPTSLSSIGKTKGLAKWSNRLEAGGKLIGYLGDAVEVMGIVSDSVTAAKKAKGGFGSKLLAFGAEAVKGTAKFVGGEIAGAAGTKAGAVIGTAIGGPVGGVIGGVVGGVIGGVLFDKGWKGLFGK